MDGSNVEGDEGATGEGEEGLNNQEGINKKRKRIKKSATVEKNLKNINIGKMELEFDVDPLFKKTTSQFDAAGLNPPHPLQMMFVNVNKKVDEKKHFNKMPGGGGNQFLASLRLRDDSSALMMDRLEIGFCQK